ncbi:MULTISPECIES: ImmA/IrrE family metallo-endopeptidase [Amycolatopsis]|uniref:ImmA/IrrE family metallo-endopeptidase n=1 Tax=Amycolatopsis albidoflavus TaxID=102226 RepID=A0ABW5HQJ9_9PSEU
MKWGRGYDPYVHAESLGVEVVRSNNVHGWGDYRAGVIRVHGTLTQDEARCTVTHELVHHEHRDDTLGYCGVGWLDTRLERQVHATAARRLIVMPELADALRWSDHPNEIAEQLGVDVRTLYARVLDLERAEYDDLHKRLGGRERRTLDDLHAYAARRLPTPYAG